MDMKVTNDFYDYANVPNYGTSYIEVMGQSQGRPLSQVGVVCTIIMTEI